MLIYDCSTVYIGMEMVVSLVVYIRKSNFQFMVLWIGLSVLGHMAMCSSALLP